MSRKEPEEVVQVEAPELLLVDNELAGAIFTAASNQTGYVNTMSNSHATKQSDGVVRVEMGSVPNQKTVRVKVPDQVAFELVPE